MLIVARDRRKWSLKSQTRKNSIFPNKKAFLFAITKGLIVKITTKNITHKILV